MSEFFRDILKDVRSGENIDVYVAVLGNGILALLSILNILPIQILGGAILASLSWLTLNSLMERKASKRDMDAIVERFQNPRVSSISFFSENYSYNSDDFQMTFRSAHELYVIGMGQTRMIIAYGAQISRILSEGGKTYFILGDPDGVGTEMSMKRGSARQSIERTRQEHWSSIERLASLNKASNNKGIIEVRFVDMLMPFTLYGFDLNDPLKAKIYVWLTPFQEPSENRPGFMLSAMQDPKWFNFFRLQFEKLWKWDETKICDLEKI